MTQIKQNQVTLNFLFIYLFFIFLTNVNATTLYVGPNETFTTITAAVDAAAAGDTIIVKDGTYDEHVFIDESITLQAENRQNAIIGGATASQGGCVVLQSDNITINGFTISGDLGGGPPGILIQNSSSGHIIKNNLIQDRDTGISTEDNEGNGTNISITGNTIENCGEGGGIELEGAGGFAIQNNTIQNNGGCGIDINDGSGASIQGNTIYKNNESGINIEDSGPDNTVTINNSNEITENSGPGVQLHGMATVQGNLIEKNTHDGIAIGDGLSNIVINNNNQIINNGGNGIGVETTSTATIENNTINENGENGVLLWGSATISNNTINSNGTAQPDRHGVMIAGSATLQGNTIQSNRGCGVWVASSEGTVNINTSNNISNNVHHGIFIQNSAMATIANNTINSNGITVDDRHGVMIEGSATLQGNTIQSNGGNGVNVAFSAGTVNINTGNDISSNCYNGILVRNPASATIQNNTINNNCTIIEPGDWDYFAGVSIEGSATVSSNTIENNEGSGIVVASNASNVTISNNSAIKGNREGLSIQGPATLVDNTIKNNTYQGVEIITSAINVTLDHNTIESNNWSGVSISGGASNITLKNNTISSNPLGVACGAAAKLRSNTIEDNTDVGVKIWNASMDLGQNSDTEAGNNIIRNNTNWNVENTTETSVSAYRNFWGLTNATDIDTTILDDDEDESKGPVNFDPFLTEEPTVSVEQIFTESNIPKTINLSLAYPNPFNPKTKIHYTLSENANITLKVLDIRGRTVQTIIQDQQQLSGNYSVHWNGTDNAGRMVSSGTYFLVLNAGEMNKTQKVMFLR